MPGWSAMAPAFISAVGNVAGGLLGRSGGMSSRMQMAFQDIYNRQAEERQRAYQDKWSNLQRKDWWDLERNRISYAVQDAKRAGLHPLFALGGAGGGSGPSFAPMGGSISPVMPGQAESGSFAGDAVRGAAEVATALMQRGNTLQDKLLEAQIRRTNAETKQIESRAALETQAANHTRPAVTMPLGSSATPKVEAREVVHEPARTMPERITIIDEKGRKLQTLNPEAGFDEIGQVDYVLQRLKRGLFDFFVPPRDPRRHGVKAPR